MCVCVCGCVCVKSVKEGGTEREKVSFVLRAYVCACAGVCEVIREKEKE